MQISYKGVIKKFHQEDQGAGAQVWLDAKTAGIHRLSYENDRRRPVCVNDFATLAIVEKVQYIYYGTCDEDDVKNNNFKRRGGMYLVQLLAVLLLVIFFYKK